MFEKHTPLDTWLLGDNDQPTCCPKCGRRTEFSEETDRDGAEYQHHHCKCGYEFILLDTFSTQEQIQAEITLDPLKCYFCGSTEVIFSQIVGDARCEECGAWQTEEDE